MSYNQACEFNAEEQRDHIVDWIKDYFAKEGPDAKAVIGISGGKDSTIAAALLVRALGRDKVVGVLMPNGTQSDIADSKRVCEYLNIPSYEINIGSACNALYRAIDEGYDFDKQCNQNPMVSTNTPARLRMTILYAVAALVHGRVCCTGNRSERYVGYTTKFGDSAGDFAPLLDYTVKELLLIGDTLDLPTDLVHKTPSDGMCGASDEDNLGFTYEELDNFLIDKTRPNYDSYKKIVQRHKTSEHKRRAMPACDNTSDRNYMAF